MTTCPKCGAGNPDNVNRCSACQAMLPIKLGTASEELYERSGLRPTHVNMHCPHCGAENPYTRVRCHQCDGLLAPVKRRGNPYQRWLYLAVGVVVLVVVFVVLKKA